jgi:hypothetical protein
VHLLVGFFGGEEGVDGLKVFEDKSVEDGLCEGFLLSRIEAIEITSSISRDSIKGLGLRSSHIALILSINKSRTLVLIAPFPHSS